jgi:hypothetical protein
VVGDALSIGKILDIVWERRWKGHWLCPCGSGEIIRKCHGPTMRLIGERVPEAELKLTLARIASLLDRDRGLQEEGKPAPS